MCYTTNGFDALSRITSVTTPDTPQPQQVTTTYALNAVTVSDQTGKTRKSQFDALGRLTNVWEDPAGLNYLTQYSYDALNNVTTITQDVQTRTFTYDGLSRLKTARIPEQVDTTTPPIQLPTTYTYDENGNLLSKTFTKGGVSITASYGEELHKRVVGQDEAVSAVADAIVRARSGLKDPNRPIGSFIFLGPTGVGKTELARALAEFLFDDERALIRIDMSEYQEKHTVARLIGAPPGYVGYEEGGQLTESVRRRPYSVILFDEIEKAHHDVFNVMLQILDDGRLTDGQGRTVDFKNTIVIMTSNIGSHRILEYSGAFEGEAYERMKAAVLEEMRHYFRPEFLNRVDEIIVFHALSEAHLKQIVEIQLDRLRARLAERHIRIELTNAARTRLVRIGYDPTYGARPLKRAIQREIETPLGRRLLKGEVRDGQTVILDYDSAKGWVTNPRKKSLYLNSPLYKMKIREIRSWRRGSS